MKFFFYFNDLIETGVAMVETSGYFCNGHEQNKKFREERNAFQLKWMEVVILWG